MAGSLKTDAPLTLALQCRIEDCWEEPITADTGVADDITGMQGAWHSIGGPREAVLLVCGNRFAFHFVDGDIYMGVFDLDAVAAPKAMDMRIEAGPSRYLGKTALCIYALEDHELRWCAASPGKGGRRKAFPVEDDSQTLCLVFRRDQRL